MKLQPYLISFNITNIRGFNLILKQMNDDHASHAIKFVFTPVCVCLQQVNVRFHTQFSVHLHTQVGVRLKKFDVHLQQIDFPLHTHVGVRLTQVEIRRGAKTSFAWAKPPKAICRGA